MIATDDPRHGLRSGYIAGCRNECCRNPHLRYQKRSSLRRLREGSQRLSTQPILDRLAHWHSYGVTTTAVATAAGISEATLLRVLDGRQVATLKPTRAAVLAVTWDDLPDNTFVYADLSRARLYSMMAAGHPLRWLCDNVARLNMGGKWRSQEKVTLGFARDVQRLYITAPYWGPSQHTASKARRKGHLPPAGWDDLDTPAAPLGWRPERVRAETRPARTDVDEAVVLRVMAGERLPMTTGERREVVARLRGRGWSEEQIRTVTGISKATSKKRFGEASAA